jgi:hypothetical protein
MRRGGEEKKSGRKSDGIDIVLPKSEFWKREFVSDIARSCREYVASSLLGANGNPLIILGNFLQHMQHEKSRLLTG